MSAAERVDGAPLFLAQILERNARWETFLAKIARRRAYIIVDHNRAVMEAEDTEPELTPPAWKRYDWPETSDDYRRQLADDILVQLRAACRLT